LKPVPRLLRTNAFRLAAGYFALFAASVLALLAFVYLSTADFVERQTKATINAEIRGLTTQYEENGLQGLIDLINTRIAGQQIHATLYLITDDHLHPVAGNLSAWPAEAVRPGWIEFPIEARDGDELESGSALAVVSGLRDGYRLLVGRDLRDVTAFRSRFDRTLAWTALATVALGLAGGLLSTRNIMRRVEAMTQTSERIIHGDFSQRVAVDGSGDEFDQLSANLNAILERIERLMAGMRQVTENIAHDLRTPLARLRARLEITLLERPDTARSIEALRETIAEADRLLATFNALLRIAEAEAGARQNTLALVDLAEIARSMAELYEPVAEEKGLGCTVDTDPVIMVRGDRLLLSQMIVNLVDNALKYTSAGAVTLSARRAGALARLEITDSGPGIPPDQREVVFDRFVRLEGSRSTPGNGLGLSLVRAVATLHGGSVSLEDAYPGRSEPGLKVVFTLPASEESAAPTASSAGALRKLG
jgi:signal transduction histidine kinase